METTISPALFAVAWLIGLIITMEIGLRRGAYLLKLEPGNEMAGMDMIGGAVFALFGLIIAFTLSGGISRYDQRRMLIAEEANDIGTAYLRLDLLPDSVQPGLRVIFRDYVDSRINVYDKLPDMAAVKADFARSAAIQQDIWKRSVAATRAPGAHVDAGKLLIPALNSMIDITSTRFMAGLIHPPRVLYLLMFVLGLGCSLIVGIRMANTKRRSWLHVCVFAILVSCCAYVILALEYPRISFINLGEYDQVLVELRDSMK